jgi:hypothetical protein
MVIMLVVGFGELVKVVLMGRVGKGVGGFERRYGTAGFSGPCVCLGVFLLFSRGCSFKGLQGTRVVYTLYSRLVSVW